MAHMSHLSSCGPPGCLRTSLQAVVSSVVEHKLLVSADGKKKADRTSPAPPATLSSVAGDGAGAGCYVPNEPRWESSECNAWQTDFSAWQTFPINIYCQEQQEEEPRNDFRGHQQKGELAAARPPCKRA